jgi:hypothetical protein
MFVTVVPRPRELVFVEDAESHGGSGGVIEVREGANVDR